MLKSLKIGVLGGGSWGTALARLLALKGHDVTIWAYEKEVTEGINSKHRNPIYLSEIDLPENLSATNDLQKCLKEAEIIVSVVPSHALRTVLINAAPFIRKNAIIVSCTKGIETSTGKAISDILKETLTEIGTSQFTFLSGPSFAIEVAKDLPTSVVVAGTDHEITKTVQEAFRTDTFLTFTHHDVIGVELGGALKNVIAIAAGMSDGLGFGANSRAALITRGLYEIIKIGKARGANPLTFTGLSGMGDLILTCTSGESRNYTLGYQLGQGKKLADILKNMKTVAEGVKTTEAVHNIIKAHKITAPICEEMYNILYNEKSPQDAAKDLTSMELRAELGKLLS